VHRPIRIGVTGAHGTGTTTLVRRIEMELRAEGVSVARTGRLARRAADLGLPTMTEHTAASTGWIVGQGIADEIAAATTADVVLVDRTAMDAVAYWHAALAFRGEVPEPQDDERLRLLASMQHAGLHLVVATVLDYRRPRADPRDVAAERFRELVDRHIHDLLAEERAEYLRVHPGEEE
jgi:nicotinamide riboside kinase